MNILKNNQPSKSFADNKVIDIYLLPIYEFLGQNGAGKTTVMKMLLSLHTSDSGEITVNNQQVRFDQTKTTQYIGYSADV